jgi:methanogenic corrinoid protein MtbC1
VNDLVDAMAKMKEQEALDLAEKMLNAGENPLKVLALCREAVTRVGKQFELGQYFLPELVLVCSCDPGGETAGGRHERLVDHGLWIF